jgi:hypothetical protein
MPFVSSIRGTFGPASENKGVGNGGQIAELLRQDPNNSGLPTGGTITTAGGYRIHSFTTTGSSSFNLNAITNLDVEVLMVGGGGGTGQYAGGGGGGEVLWILRSISTATNALFIGAGGVGSNGTFATTMHGQSTTGFGETAKPGGGGKSSDDATPPNNGTDTSVGNLWVLLSVQV